MSLFLIQVERIEKLKDIFYQSSKILPYSCLGSEGVLNAEASNAGQRLLDIQAALIAQLVLLAKTSSDQVAISLQIFSHMEFFGSEVFPNPDDLNTEYHRTGRIMEAYIKACGLDLMAAKELHGSYAKYMGVSSGTIGAKFAEKIQGLSENIIAEAKRYYDTTDRLREMGARLSVEGVYFDEDEEPSLSGKNPHIALRELCEATIENTENAIDQNIDYATMLLSKKQFLQKRIMPIMPYAVEELEEEALATYEQAKAAIQRIDALTRYHGERTKALEHNFV